MTGCLPDGVLWALSEGDGSAAEGEHLASCGLCTWRARRLTRDLQVLGRILGAPPPRSLAVPPAPRRLRWAVAAALAGLTIGLARMRPATVAGLPLLAESEVEAGLAPLPTDSEVEAAFAPALPTDPEAESELAAVLPGDLETMEVPCEWQPAGCDDETGALF
jgi:hypothetical protein